MIDWLAVLYTILAMIVFVAIISTPAFFESKESRKLEAFVKTLKIEPLTPIVSDPIEAKKIVVEVDTTRLRRLEEEFERARSAEWPYYMLCHKKVKLDFKDRMEAANDDPVEQERLQKRFDVIMERIDYTHCLKCTQCGVDLKNMVI